METTAGCSEPLFRPFHSRKIKLTANSDVFRAMTAYRPVRVFLPWASSLLSRNFLPFIDAFIGPNLKDVDMECMEWPQDDDSLRDVSIPLLSSARLSTGIQSLTFRHTDTIQFNKPLFDLVALLPNLRHLFLSTMSIGTEAMISLARLPLLETRCGVHLKQELLSLFAIRENIFPSLTELESP
jgi:hypothetical protein